MRFLLVRQRFSLSARSASAWLILATLLLSGCANMVQPLERDPWIAPDKGLHLLSGIGLGAAGAAIASSKGASACTANASGVALGFSVGLGKEWRDLHHNDGMPSNRDWLVTILGGIIGAQLVQPCSP
ncbi:hypothetical protein [Hydrocarboniclastica marina]|uniref:hypothetical protein n=1 Tax=Hydrocarboniclastica marina TaxID=2259620 RepID=UPI0010A755FD|nr:hypothetical protein [Hydrocarboniclastica marina]|tara:strand:- start:317 stop:700 length:384 start_codon:yes stop_codon:yes gene_type:complete